MAGCAFSATLLYAAAEPIMPDTLWLVLALSAIFFIGVTKSGFGSGVGLIIVPATALAMANGAFAGRGEAAALGLLLPLLVAGDLIAIWQHRDYLLHRNGSEKAAADASHPVRTTRDVMRRLLPGTVAGVVLASLLLWWFHQQREIVGALIRIEIGIESILLVGLAWWRQYKGLQTSLVPEPARSISTGVFAGASSTLAHAAGPIFAMYLLPLNLDRKTFVASSALYFFVLNTLKLPFYWQAGLFEQAELSFTLMFLPVVAAGAVFGFAVNKRLNDKLFSKIIYFATFLLGWYILIDGTWTLVRYFRS